MRVSAMEIKNLTKLADGFIPTSKQIEAAKTSIKLRKARKIQEILVVDEDATAGGLIKALLQSKYKVVASTTARKAWLSYLVMTPDIVFVQSNLPDLTGDKLTRMIKVIDPGSYLVMLADEDSQNGVSDYIPLYTKSFLK